MLVYVKGECFVMQMLYVCVLCTSCGSSQCCIMHDLQFVSSIFIRVFHTQKVKFANVYIYVCRIIIIFL